MDENTEGQEPGSDDEPIQKADTVQKHEPRETDLFSRVPEEVCTEVDRKLAEALPIYAVGHPHPTVRKLAGELFERLMIVRW